MEDILGSDSTRLSSCEAVAHLEPKLPILRFLLFAYETFPCQREQVLQTLRLLLETPALAAWAEAASTDQEILQHLQELKMSNGNGLSPVSAHSCSDSAGDEELAARLRGTLTLAAKLASCTSP